MTTNKTVIHDCFNRFADYTITILLYQTFGLDGKYRRCLNRGNRHRKMKKVGETNY